MKFKQVKEFIRNKYLNKCEDNEMIFKVNDYYVPENMVYLREYNSYTSKTIWYSITDEEYLFCDDVDDMNVCISTNSDDTFMNIVTLDIGFIDRRSLQNYHNVGFKKNKFILLELCKSSMRINNYYDMSFFDELNFLIHDNSCDIRYMECFHYPFNKPSQKIDLNNFLEIKGSPYRYKVYDKNCSEAEIAVQLLA